MHEEGVQAQCHTGGQCSHIHMGEIRHSFGEEAGARLDQRASDTQGTSVMGESRGETLLGPRHIKGQPTSVGMAGRELSCLEACPPLNWCSFQAAVKKRSITA